MQDPEYPGLFISSQVIEPLVSTVTVPARVFAVLRQPLLVLLDGSSKLTLPITVRIGKTLGLIIGHLPQRQCSYDVIHGRKEINQIQVEHCQAA